jgi:hypothetical protein
MADHLLSRRNFLKLAALGLGSLSLRPFRRSFRMPDFPQAERLGRVNVGRIDLKARPDNDSETVAILYEDAVVPWLREVVGRNINRTNQRWVETPDGYLWAPYLQPVQVLPNESVTSLPPAGDESGMWVEVTVPYVDMALDNPPARSPWLQDRLEAGLTPRLYYNQIMWVDQIDTDSEGQVWYRINEKYGSYGDIFWAEAEAFRPLTAEDISPVNPDAVDKRIRVDVTYQTLTCFEGNNEVYFARVSTGAKYDALGNPVDVWATPLGEHPIWRKLISLHMSGGTTGGGWDLPGVGWTTLFIGSGIAIHSTFWHNNYGEPMSRGCVNASPQDAKWVFRWSQPPVRYFPGDVSIPWPGGTIVEVRES